MQQRSLNSHFKVKKNRRDDSGASGIDIKSGEKDKLRKSSITPDLEMNHIDLKLTKTETKKDTKQIVYHTATRAKRVPLGEDDSCDDSEILVKRGKLEISKKADSNFQKEFNSEGFKEQSEQKKSLLKNKNDEVNIQIEKNISSNEEKVKPKSNFIDRKSNKCNEENLSALPQPDNEKSLGSKSTACSASSSPKSELSDFTKNLVQQVLQQKKDKDEKMKITSKFNYLNFKQVEARNVNNIDETNNASITPKKILGFVSNSREKEKETSNLKLFNSFIKPQISSSGVSNTCNKFVTPIKSKPQELKLSLRTLEEINKIKSERQERQNKFQREVQEQSERTRSESSFSLKFKYEELIKEERELVLPPHYKALYNSFTELDHTLNFFKLSTRKQRVPVFEDLKQAIEIAYKHKFEFKTFAQILYVVPHFFVYKWEKISLCKDEFSLIIDIPIDHKIRIKQNYEENFNFITLQTEKYDPICESLSNSDLEERRKVFKNLLYAIANEHHKLFLESIKFPREFDPFKFKTWHHDYNLESVPNIPIFEILEKPSIKITSIQDFLRETDIKSTLVKRAVDEINNSAALEKNSTIKQEKSALNGHSPVGDKTNSNLSKFLSEKFIKKMQAKEEAVSISKNIIEFSTQKSRAKNRVKEFQDIVDKLHTIFLMQKKTTVPLQELSVKLQNSSETIKNLYTLGKFYNSSVKIIIFILYLRKCQETDFEVQRNLPSMD